MYVPNIQFIILFTLPYKQFLPKANFIFFCIDRFQCKLRWIQKQIKLYPCLDVGYKGIYEYDEFYKIVENKRIDVYKPIFF